MLQAATWSFPPVAVLFGCRASRWTVYDLKMLGQQCVAEAGVRNPTSGFTATVGTSGYFEELDADDFSLGFSAAVAAGALRLGDAYLAGFQTVGAAVSTKLQHMTLLGDPALCINPTVTARGTPTSWLIANGLTNNAYADLSDPDGDGFPTWLEYRAGTDYNKAGTFQIRSWSLGTSASGLTSLTFELGSVTASTGFRVLTTTNLASGAWETVPWKTSATNAWSTSAIPADWPIKTLLLPYAGDAESRFYKVEADHE
jgi:hypothetical protein